MDFSEFVSGRPRPSSLLSVVLCFHGAHSVALFLTAPLFFPFTRLGFLWSGDVAVNPVNAGCNVMMVGGAGGFWWSKGGFWLRQSFGVHTSASALLSAGVFSEKKTKVHTCLELCGSLKMT